LGCQRVVDHCPFVTAFYQLVRHYPAEVENFSLKQLPTNPRVVSGDF